MKSLDRRDEIRKLVRDALQETLTTGEAPERFVVNSLRERTEREWDRDESAKSLITEDEIRGLEPESRLRIAEGAKFTPLARDLIAERRIQLIPKKSRTAALTVKSVAVGADHGGFEAKKALIAQLQQLGLAVTDFGTHSPDPVDYPDIALSVARAVAGGRADVGILIDGAGIGSAIAANKVPGIRAAACYSPQLAINAREHNGANVLTLGAGQTELRQMAAIAEAFLTHRISEERHRRRVGKIDSIDREFRR
ncbi:MAG: hypothetical protein C4325_12705 [Blastocatellia bacterium]